MLDVQEETDDLYNAAGNYAAFITVVAGYIKETNDTVARRAAGK